MTCWDCGERKGTIHAVDDHRAEAWQALSTFGDLERCPYGPTDYQQKAWLADDDVRMRRLALARRPPTATGTIHSICVICHNKWRRYLKGGGPTDGFTVVIQ